MDSLLVVSDDSADHPVPVLVPVHEELPLAVSEDRRLVADDRIPFWSLVEEKISNVLARCQTVYI